MLCRRVIPPFSSGLPVFFLRGEYSFFKFIQVLADSPDMPPLAESVYLISLKPWKSEPNAAYVPLYVGGNTSTSNRFRTRMGDLIADIFGFFGGGSGHHSGGQSLHDYCREHKINPKKLYVGWIERCDCRRCAENTIFDQMTPQLNKKRPGYCRTHC
jgi:hypothetical protein